MKDDIRYKMKVKRKYFHNVLRGEADAVIAETFIQGYGGKENFLVYNSFSTEADTHRIIDLLLAAGKKVYLPRVEGDNIVAVPYGKMKKGKFGIEEPKGQAFDGEIDVTVIPLLAVNERGFRLGYGGGYYDRYLKDKTTEKVGLGYFFQIENFAEDEWDIPLDSYVCERGIYYFENRT